MQKVPLETSECSVQTFVRIRKKAIVILTAILLTVVLLGGAMAASFIAGHTEQFSGLVLLGAYSTADLSTSGTAVLSVYGSLDGVMNRQKYEKYKKNLPKDAEEYIIEGGCHAGFGMYGVQKGDGTPTVSSQE